MKVCKCECEGRSVGHYHSNSAGSGAPTSPRKRHGGSHIQLQFVVWEGGGGSAGGSPPSGAELLEAPNAPKKICWPKLTAPKAPETSLDWLKARRKLGAIF